VVDQVVCLSSPDEFENISQVYEDFTQVPDRVVSEILDKQGKSYENTLR
jgi:predicted phosphoribosyltransferase